jgi:hypothetical protein
MLSRFAMYQPSLYRYQAGNTRQQAFTEKMKEFSFVTSISEISKKLNPP